jgi:hypothetical protein
MSANERLKTKSTGLKISHNNELRLKFLNVSPSLSVSLKTLTNTNTGERMINIHKNTILMRLATKSNASQIVYMMMTSDLRRKPIVTASTEALFPLFIYSWNLNALIHRKIRGPLTEEEVGRMLARASSSERGGAD